MNGERDERRRDSERKGCTGIEDTCTVYSCQSWQNNFKVSMHKNAHRWEKNTQANKHTLHIHVQYKLYTHLVEFSPCFSRGETPGRIAHG